MSSAAVPLLEARRLKKYFRVGGSVPLPFSHHPLLHAVDDVSLAIFPGEIVALVGESGSGKSTVARLLARVYTATSGDIFFRGKPLGNLRTHRAMLAYRSKVQMVLQDPFSSINQVYPAVHGIARALHLHRRDLNQQRQREMMTQLLTAVGLTPAEEFLIKYPYELSGGQRQRIGFAQALACGPELILADEPVSMLDVSIRIGILNLMADLRSRQNVSFLYITHDIASARYIADRMLVMYGGHVVETGPADDVLSRPRHPYTQLLVSAVPDPRAPAPPLSANDTADPPRVVDPAPGCRFRDRCPVAVSRCASETPLLRLLSDGHQAACHVAI